jgi:hypothetical protein
VKRNRVLHAAAVGLVIVIGLASRRHPGLFPQALGKYPGDALWAMMIFFGLGFLFPAKPVARIGLAALVFCCADEFSQLYHAPWIDSIRATTIGHLILGGGFSWADIAAYLAGVLMAGLIETACFKFLRGRHG